MRRLACCSFVLGCQMPNPAFEDGQLDGQADDELDATDELDSTTQMGESGTNDASTSETDTSDANTSDTNSGCGAGEQLCDGICIETTSDPLHCGGCETVCAEQQLCLDSSCVPYYLVFVSSIPLSSGPGGLLGADDFCNLLAGSAGLTPSFKAWNASEMRSPASDFVHAGPYLRTDGAMVATSWIDLVDGSLVNPIDRDQSNKPIDGVAACGVAATVWTNTNAAGEYAGPPDCAGWTLSTIDGKGLAGDAHATNANWSLIPACQLYCAEPLPIYCVQQQPGP